MIIKDADGTILESHNKLVIEQWVKAGYTEYNPHPAKEEPEEKPKRSRKKSAEE